ncbi:MAG: hypothetical protein AAGC47_15895, partial [Bacteroidota bacterium]
LFLFNLTIFEIGIQFLIAAAFIYSVGSLGTVFDNRSYGLKMELLRFFVCSGLGFGLYYFGLLPLWIPMAVVGISAISMAILLRLNFHKIEEA